MRDAALVDHSGHQTTARAVRLGSRVAGLAAPGMCALVPATGAQTTVTLISHRYPALELYAKVMDGALPGPGQVTHDSDLGAQDGAFAGGAAFPSPGVVPRGGAIDLRQSATGDPVLNSGHQRAHADTRSNAPAKTRSAGGSRLVRGSGPRWRGLGCVIRLRGADVTPPGRPVAPMRPAGGPLGARPNRRRRG